MIHVFIGTKAQYIKTAPLLWRMDADGTAYRLIDSGQHAVLATSFQDELGVREPDVRLGGENDVASIPHALGWALRLAACLVSKRRLRDRVFGGLGGVCVVHGDTPSTLLGMMLARRAGLSVAHLEAGLTSRRWLHPFPEELIRRLVARRADLLFAPDDRAVRHLEAMGARGRIVAVPGNTVLETLRRVDPAVSGEGPVIVTMHRVENLHRRRRREGLAALVGRVAVRRDVRWLLHRPSSAALGRETMDRLERCGVRLTALVGHAEFLELLAAAPFVITDGGSVQEECAMLGVPTLLWRDRTDRPDGMGANVVLSHYDPEIVGDFMADPDRYRRSLRIPATDPSALILAVLSEWR